MRMSVWLAGAFLLASAAAGRCDPTYASNGIDFQVPVDELDAAAIGEAAVHSGFYPLSESNPKLLALRKAADPVYEIWEPNSHKIATITLTKMSRSNAFVVTYVAKDPSSRRDEPLSGDACRKWLSFSTAIRLEFRNQERKYRFHAPQCTP
jgi:hypothetical protein